MTGRVIAVDGNIGVGKTTFIKSIASALDMIVVEEDFEENPYLEEFYKGSTAASPTRVVAGAGGASPASVAYKTEEWFIKNRLESYETALTTIAHSGIASRHKTVIVDRPPTSTLVFCTTLYEDGKLTEEEYENLMALYQDINRGTPQPDLYIYLDATPERCLESIRTRGRPMEQSISLEYLQHLGGVWKRMNGGFYTCPYIIVDWEAYGAYGASAP